MNHGGPRLFISQGQLQRVCRRSSRLPQYVVLTVHIQGGSLNLIVGVIYRPGSSEVNSILIDELADFIKHVAVYVAPQIIVDDVNVHLDVLLSSSTLNFNDILTSASLVQHISGPTQCVSHTLDVIITPSALEISDC